MEVTGELHVHITVDVGGGDVSVLSAWAEERGLHVTHIVLDRGETPSQPMLTWFVRGAVSARLEDARGIVDDLRATGRRVTRVKIEAAPDALGVPEDDALAGARGCGGYFEHHVKLALVPGWDRCALEAVLRPHRAHLSRNARARGEGGREHRFVTQRVYGAGRGTARAHLDALVADLQSAGVEIIELEQEYTVYDSNATLDRGWMEPE